MLRRGGIGWHDHAFNPYFKALLQTRGRLRHRVSATSEFAATVQPLSGERRFVKSPGSR
jgi:hypothetical protein